MIITLRNSQAYILMLKYSGSKWCSLTYPSSPPLEKLRTLYGKILVNKTGILEFKRDSITRNEAQRSAEKPYFSKATYMSDHKRNIIEVSKKRIGSSQKFILQHIQNSVYDKSIGLKSLSCQTSW